MAEDRFGSEEEIDIEELMQEIREQILAKKAALSPEKTPPFKLKGERFPAEFYDHLYQASLAYDRVEAKMHVTRSSVPLVGPLLQWLRTKLHELVLFYVNQVASRQIDVNTHLLRALSILAEELESSPPPQGAPEGGDE